MRRFVLPGSILTLIYRGAGVALVFVVTAMLARHLTVPDFGRYAFILSVITVASLFSDKLVPGLLVRELSNKDRDEVDLGLIRSAFTITFMLACVILALVVLTGFATGSTYFFHWALAALAIPVLAFNSVRDGVLRGMHRPVTAQFIEQILRPGVQLALLSVFFYFFATEPGLTEALMAFVLSVVFVSIVGILVLRAGLDIHLRSLASFSLVKSRLLIVEGIGFVLIGGLAVINAHVDVILITIILDDTSAALFKAAQQPAQLIQMFPVAIYGYMLPRLARLLIRGDIDGTNRFVRRFIRYCAAMSFVLLVGIVWFGPMILEIIYGESYGQSYPAMAVMSGAFFLEVLTGPKAGVMNMMGRQYLTAALAFAGIALNAIIDILFLETYGYIAAAYGTLVSSVFIGVTMAVYCKRKLGVVSYLS